MAGLSDLIAEFLLSTIGDDEKVTISRNSLAEHFACAPSQINYMLSTRFNSDTGYVVESKRGGSGYITLIKLSSDKADYLKELIDEVSHTPLPDRRMTAIVSKLERDGIITPNEGKLITAACSDKAFLTVGGTQRDVMRSGVFRSVLLELLKS